MGRRPRAGTLTSTKNLRKDHHQEFAVEGNGDPSTGKPGAQGGRGNWQGRRPEAEGGKGNAPSQGGSTGNDASREVFRPRVNLSTDGGEAVSAENVLLRGTLNTFSKVSVLGPERFPQGQC